MNKKLKGLLFALLFTFGGLAVAQVVDALLGGKNSYLQWDAPTTNEDGSVLDDLDGYEVGVFDAGVVPDESVPVYTENIIDPTVTSVDLLTLLTNAGISAGTYTFAVLAYDTHGNKSVWSNSLDIDIKVVSPNTVVLEHVRK